MIKGLSAAIAVVSTFVAAGSPALALEDWEKAFSLRANSVNVCAPVDGAASPERCDPAVFAALSKRLDLAFALALARAKPETKPLLMRDQVWVREMIESFDGILGAPGADEDVAARSADMFTNRTRDLDAIQDSLGRKGLAGRWVNAFGSVEIAPETNGARRVTVRTAGAYGTDYEHVRKCAVAATVVPAQDGWLAGDVTPVVDTAAENLPQISEPGTAARPAARIKIMRHGETLRIVAFGGDTEVISEASDFGCSHQNQITGTYFSASSDASDSVAFASSPFVAPTFDCAAPQYPTEEEICADPELASADQDLNRAWKALLSQLDPETRRHMIEDQRSYVSAQARQFEQFLYPSWEKAFEGEPFTTEARESVRSLQRERIALLEGFDAGRKGLEGLWLAYDAILEVTRGDDGTLSTAGEKWDHSDYRRTCDFNLIVYDDGRPTMMRPQGNVVPEGTPAGVRLVREHATLVIERADMEEALCNRSLTPDARLFPVRPSPDINTKLGSFRRR